MSFSPNMRGAFFMSVAMAGFTINDALTKGLMAELNVGQVMLVRGIFATAMIALLAYYNGAFVNLGAMLNRHVFIRIAADIGATVSFLAALAHLPLANITAVLQALPLAVTVGAAFFLRERIGWRRWAAISIGFAGVMVIVRPGMEGFNAYSLLVLLSVCIFVVRDLATRLIPHDIPTLAITTATATAVTVFGGLLVIPFGGWTPMGFMATGQLAAAAVMLLLGYHCIIMSIRSGDLSYAAPFRYTALLWALVIGIVFFGEIPDWATIAGAALVVGSGIYTLYRERLVSARRPAAKSVAPAEPPARR